MKGRCRRKKGISKWEEERCGFFEDRGTDMEEMETQKDEGVFELGRLVTKDVELDRKKIWEKIEESRFNAYYNEIKGKGIPENLKKGWEESRWQRVAKFRLGNGIRKNGYWKDEEEKKCRICGREGETWEHIWERCVDWG
ncbi:hypothetical protein RF55_12706 [Lasius niger]|uniref:Uncharacterized protein n=1 Tax=Lasius niger TaxID=67767 RepID=A0A0J7KC53_LASNI|nr:hypothetical protein RF55_12706 [Lasius niger]